MRVQLTTTSEGTKRAIRLFAHATATEMLRFEDEAAMLESYAKRGRDCFRALTDGGIEPEQARAIMLGWSKKIDMVLDEIKHSVREDLSV